MPKKSTAKTAPKAPTAKPAVAESVAESPAPKRGRRAYLPAHERRQRIIAAAQKVFAETHLQGARTRDLARAAEVNQATLFEHFESKEALFIAAVIEPMLELMQGMRERAQAYEEADSLDDLLKLARQVAQRHLDTMMDIYPLLVSALFSDPALGKKLYREQITPMLKERSAATSRLVKDGVDKDFISLAYFGIFFAVAMDRAFTGKKVDSADLARQATILFSQGALKDHS